MSSSEDPTRVPVLPTDSVPEFCPTFRLQWEQAQNCHVVLYPEGMVKLNQSAGEILRRCDGKRSVGEIATELATCFQGTRENILQDISRFLLEAMQRGWIHV